VALLEEIFDVGINFNIATFIDSHRRGVHILKEDIWSDVSPDLSPITYLNSQNMDIPSSSSSSNPA
jgi:hypothetical protein